MTPSLTPSDRLEATNIGLTSASRHEVIAMLNRLLADTMVLFIKTKNAYWNVSGPIVHDLHTLLDQYASTLLSKSDELAERVRVLGGMPLGTLSDFLKCAALEELPVGSHSAGHYISSLLKDLESIIRYVRLDVEVALRGGDVGTADLFSGFIRDLEKQAWFLREYLQQP